MKEETFLLRIFLGRRRSHATGGGQEMVGKKLNS